MEDTELEVGRLAVKLCREGMRSVWRARYPVRGVSPFIVSPQGVGTPEQDIVIGVSPRFDANYVVKSQDPLLMRRLWCAQACELLLKMGNAWVEGSLEELIVSRPGWAEKDGARPGLDLLAALDANDPIGIDAMEKVEGGKYFPPHGPFEQRTPPVVSVAGPVEVLIEPIYYRGAVVTTCRALGRPEGQTDSEYVGELELSRTAAREYPELLDRVGHVHLVQRSRELWLLWHQVVREPAALDAGVQLMHAVMRTPSFGPYR